MISKQFHEYNVGLGNLVGGGDLIHREADGFETCCGQI